MRAEIIVIGSELLLGESIDTNGPWIAEHLRQIGIDCHFKAVVGDNLDNIANTFTLALSRADIVLSTGGLGPTQDDISKDGLAKALGKPLVFDERLAERIAEKFAERGRNMSENNLRQAYYPEGAKVLATHPGTAPGIHYTISNDAGDKQIFLMPGVPSEMKLMMSESIIPFLLNLLPNPEQVFTRTMKCWGLPESDIAEKLKTINDELDHAHNPKLAYLASGINGIKVKLSSKNRTLAEADQLIDPYKARIVEILGDYIFGYDDDSMESVVANLLETAGLTLALYETFSAGLVSSRLNELTDSTPYFRGAVINHDSNNIFTKLQDTAEYFGADIALNVSEVTRTERNITLALNLYHGDTQLTKEITIPSFSLGQTRRFSVINLLNQLRLYLQKRP